MTEILLLSLLSRRDLYGYEINRVLRKKYMHFTRVSFSSIYYTLDKLEKKGLITKREEKVGNRPARHIYQITPKGRAELEKKLHRKIRKESMNINTFDPFSLPFSLMGKLPSKMGVELLKTRLELVEEHLQRLEREYTTYHKLIETKNIPELDIFALMLIKRGVLHLNAEKKWLEETISELTKELQKEESE